MNRWYREDLAYIHDVGHGEFARRSAPAILDILARDNLHEGTIVDLGCGSGISALAFTRAGYRVLGIDLSESLIAIARTRVPTAEFRVGSLFKADIPPCVAIASIGECLNYLFDADNDRQALGRLFERVYNALIPGGIFLFDIVEPGALDSGDTTRNFTEGEDWFVLVERRPDLERALLTRRIVTFRKMEEEYRRDDEVHVQRLYGAGDLAAELRRVGFEVEVSPGYGRFVLPKARAVLIARKTVG